MENKIIAALLSGFLAIGLTACGAEDNKAESVEEETEVEETETAETNQEDQEETDDESLEEVAQIYASFQKLAEKINEMTYEEAAEYMGTTGLSYNATEPNKNDSGDIITKDDEYGFHLYIDFSVNENGADTICLVSYGNGYYEGYVSDNYHAGDVSYNTYNVYNEEKSKKVDSLDDVLTYIEDEIPVLMEEHENKEDGESSDANEE